MTAVSGLRRRPVLRLVAIAACLPYLCLKVAWIAGSHLGIPDGSPLLEHRVTMALANGLTVLMDAAVVVLALLLTQPWGRRVPAWLLAVPMWVATGLLAPIMVGFPLQMMVHGSGTGHDDRPFLHAWVFDVVYGGFIVQGIALGTLFVGYARERWGYLWQGRVWELPRPSAAAAQRMTAVTAALLALVPGTFRLLWAGGVTAGRNTSGGRLMELMYVGFLAAAVTGACQLAFRRGGPLPVTVPLALAWAGSGAVACWGGWVSLATLVSSHNLADRPTPAMSLTYAVQMIVGFLVASVAAHHFADRSAKAPR
ncbi:aromatic ring-opening dioxygenase LigA [Streptomyces cellostaticus]|uniref:Aromatic ring-opening dioxygenase LigA n=2 Tax=Streptomyces cellostaticus TaxID=67285 RepID=A0A124HDP2_9ACTN|nr:aromatic ring-opening dioxygenase LigA [Streptomyces cellostaticus]